MAAAATKVCVTGAGGFVASWLIKLLLSKCYHVHGTVRELGNPKYDHLLKFERASENLKLFKADLLDYESLHSPIVGCRTVFHLACPVLEFSSHNQRVVFISSRAAISMNPNLPKDGVIDESCWSDKDYCRRTKNWYWYAKTEAEMQALDFARNTGLPVVTICPTLVLGPILQASTVNASSLVLLKLFKGPESMENKQRCIVDVRDVADAILMAHEKPEAEGRYLCTAHSAKTYDLVEKLRSMYPNYSYPKNYIEVDDDIRLSKEKLQRLGWRYRPLEETLVDSVESYKAAGLLESK